MLAAALDVEEEETEEVGADAVVAGPGDALLKAFLELCGDVDRGSQISCHGGAERVQHCAAQIAISKSLEWAHRCSREHYYSYTQQNPIFRGFMRAHLVSAQPGESCYSEIDQQQQTIEHRTISGFMRMISPKWHIDDINRFGKKVGDSANALQMVYVTSFDTSLGLVRTFPLPFLMRIYQVMQPQFRMAGDHRCRGAGARGSEAGPGGQAEGASADGGSPAAQHGGGDGCPGAALDAECAVLARQANRGARGGDRAGKGGSLHGRRS